MRTYKPRRCSARWLDGDCPPGVLAIMDNPAFADRYTVLYAEVYDYEHAHRRYIVGRGMSEDPFHPQGVGLSFEMQTHEAAAYRYRNKHRYCRWTDLPARVQQAVRQDLAED